VCGPNSENEWAREGRRIIPLLKRASVITSLTEVANKAKLDVQSNNKILLSPLRTKTFSKYNNQDELNGESIRNNASIKKEFSNRNLYSTPPSLDDIMVKVSKSGFLTINAETTFNKIIGYLIWGSNLYLELSF